MEIQKMKPRSKSSSVMVNMGSSDEEDVMSLKYMSLTVNKAKKNEIKLKDDST